MGLQKPPLKVHEGKTLMFLRAFGAGVGTVASVAAAPYPDFITADVDSSLPVPTSTFLFSPDFTTAGVGSSAPAEISAFSLFATYVGAYWVLPADY